MAYQFARKLAIVFIIALFLGAQIGRQVRAELEVSGWIRWAPSGLPQPQDFQVKEA